MTETQERTASSDKKAISNEKSESRSGEIDRNAPAGSEHSLGAQSVRDSRPATGDDIVEAIDEAGPGIADLNGK